MWIIDDDVLSYGNYVIMSKQPPSWIFHLGFQDFSKTSETRKMTEKYSAATETLLKRPKNIKIAAFKVVRYPKGNV